MPNIYLSPEDRASNTYAPTALWNGRPTNEKEQMARCADLLETALTRCGFAVKNAQWGSMYDRVKESNAWPAHLHMALHTNGFNGKVAGTRVHCYPSEESRRIGRLIQDHIARLSPGDSDKLVEDAGLYELRATHMPAVLPEFGFHDEPEEAQWIIDDLKRIVEETCRAVCEYFDKTYQPPEEQADDTPQAPGTPEKPEQDTPLYRVQAGAFRFRRNAEDYCQKLKAAGFPEAFVTEA